QRNRSPVRSFPSDATKIHHAELAAAANRQEAIAQGLQIVAKARGPLEFQVARGLQHLFLDLADALVELLLGKRVVARLFFGDLALLAGAVRVVDAVDHVLDALGDALRLDPI